MYFNIKGVNEYKTPSNYPSKNYGYSQTYTKYSSQYYKSNYYPSNYYQSYSKPSYSNYVQSYNKVNYPGYQKSSYQNYLKTNYPLTTYGKYPNYQKTPPYSPPYKPIKNPPYNPNKNPPITFQLFGKRRKEGLKKGISQPIAYEPSLGSSVFNIKLSNKGQLKSGKVTPFQRRGTLSLKQLRKMNTGSSIF